MPARPSWFLRIPDILEEVRSVPVPFLDRAAVEKLFRVRRRRAQQLMAWFEGIQIGRTFLIDRSQIIQTLEAIQRGQDFEVETRRKARLTETLAEARRTLVAHKVHIPVDSGASARVLAGLPLSVRLEPGLLRIEFSGAEDLLRQLFELAQAISNDYDRFEQLLA